MRTSANCIYTDVKQIIDTGASSGDIASLIALADEEITTRGLTGSAWTANNLKRLSMLITAEMLSNKDTAARSVNDTGEPAVKGPFHYRRQAEELIQTLASRAGEGIPFVSYSEPEE